MAGLTVKLDTGPFVKFITDLTASKMRTELKNALNRTMTISRKAFVNAASKDTGLSVAIVNKSLSRTVRASPWSLVTSFTATKSRVLILKTAGAKFAKGSGLTAAIHTLTGGGSSHLAVAKAFTIVGRGGNKLLMVRGKSGMKTIYGEHIATALGRPGIPRQIFVKTAQKVLPRELAKSLSAALHASSTPDSSG